MFLPITTKNVEDFLLDQTESVTLGGFSRRFLMTEDRHYKKVEEVLDKLVAKGKVLKVKRPSEVEVMFGPILSRLFDIPTSSNTNHYIHANHKESMK